jgi:hypothetical protein
LSKTLDSEAATLSSDDAQREKDLRPKVVAALANFATDQSEVGRVLFDYKSVYKTKRKWTSFAKEIAKAIKCSERTVYRMIDEYEALSGPATNSEVPLDRIEIDGPKLSKQEKHERDARLAIRVFLNNFPERERRKMLAELLAEESHQVWGKREPFSIELEVRPRPSKLTIDGRKKPLQIQAEENAA